MEGRRADAQRSEQERVVFRRVDPEQRRLRHPAQRPLDVGGGMENMLWVVNSPRVVRQENLQENLQSLLAPLPSQTHVPNKDNKDKVFEAAVFLYNTNRDGNSERAKLAANLFRNSLGTNAKIADVMLDNDTLRIKLVRPFQVVSGVIADFQLVSVCKQGYTATRPTHVLETFTQLTDLDSWLPVEQYGPQLRTRMYDTINAHTWVPVREMQLVTTTHPVLQVR